MPYLAPALIFLLLIAPAIRLVVLAIRTRQTPEIWGAAFFLGTGVGVPLRLLGYSIAANDPALASQVNALGHVFFACGAASMAVFTWRVFRPESKGARLACFALASSIAATTIHLLVSGGGSVEQGIGMLLTNAARVLPMLWALGESHRYWRAMRRREAIGLADPVVTNRFGLWVCWVGGLAALPAVTLSIRVFGRVGGQLGLVDPLQFAQSEPVGLLIRVVAVLSAPIAAVALSLSFFPPERYLTRIRGRA